MSSQDDASANVRESLRMWAEGAIKADVPEQVRPHTGAEKALQLHLGHASSSNDSIIRDDHELLNRIRNEVTSARQRYEGGQGEPLPELVAELMRSMQDQAAELAKRLGL